MNINHNRLIPGSITYWGDIVGDLTDQKDLVNYVASHGGGGGGDTTWGSIQGNIENQTDLMTKLDGYATEEWVENQGFLTEHQSLEGYATEQWVGEQGYLVQDDLSQYATRQWVTGRGYITSDDLNGYATETWVGQQGYITSAALSGYATQDWVGDQGYIDQIKTVNNQSLIGDGNIEIEGLTPEQEDAIDPLVNRTTEGYLHYVPGVDKIPAETMIGYEIQNEDHLTPQRRVFNIGGEVYYLNRGDNCIYIYDSTTCEFNYHCSTTGYAEIGNVDYVLWEDSQGRVYYYNQYKVDLDTGEFTSWNMGGDYVQYDGVRNSNLIQRDGVTYLISTANSCAYIFNESSQEFDSSIPITGTFPATGTTFARYLTEFDGHIVYDDVTHQVEFVFHLDEENPYIDIVNIENELFPHNWDYTDPKTGTVYAENTRAVFVHPVTINRQTDYYVMGYPQLVMFKLVNGVWEAVEDFGMAVNYASNTAGAYAGDMWFGYGYDRNNGKKMLIWNFGEAKGIPELYRFDSNIQDRVENLENAGFTTSSDVEDIVNDMGCMKLVERDDIEFPMVERPDADIDDGYYSEPYVIGLSESFGQKTVDGDTVNTKTDNYTYIEGGYLKRKEKHYVDDGNGGWDLETELEFESAWYGGGWDLAQIHYLGDDPDYQGRIDDFPVDQYFDIGWDKLPFGFTSIETGPDGEVLVFSGFCWDKVDEKLGLYKVTPNIVPGVGFDGYDETFIPFIAAEEPDTSTDATYVLKATVQDGEVTYEWVPENVI